MANEIIALSPGVFTSENDLSALPQQIGEIGAVVIGAFTKGPAFVPTSVTTTREVIQTFGNQSPDMYASYAVRNYLKHAPKATVVRVLGEDGYSVKAPIALSLSGSFGQKLISVLHPSYVVTSDDSTSIFELSTLSSNSSGSAVLRISGSFITDTTTFTSATDKNGTSYSMSLDFNNSSFVENIFGRNPKSTEPAFNYVLFKQSSSASLATDASAVIVLETGSIGTPQWDFTDSYQHAVTPWITSQDIGGGTTQNLFKFHTLSDGNTSNIEVKVGIQDIRPAGTIAGSEYGEFVVVVRGIDQDKIPVTPFDYDDSDNRPLILESFVCNLNPDSPKYIEKVIGDRYFDINSSTNRIEIKGDYSNKSQYIRVEVDQAVKSKAISNQLVPFGFKAPYSPIPTGFTQPDGATYVTTQEMNGAYNKRVFFGFDYNFGTTDNVNYLSPLPSTDFRTIGNNTDFLLSNYTQHPSASFPNSSSPYTGSINLTSNTSTNTRKFIVPFQGGFDGWRPHIQKKTGIHISSTNTQGFDLSNASTSGYTAFKKAIDVVSNPEQYDINLVVIPGVLHKLHSSITQYTIDMCEERNDCFYIMDSTEETDNVATAISVVEGLDTNYAATYYPWVKIKDFDNNKDIWTPPSVAMIEAYAFNDKVSDPWWAPAGLNRGLLSSVIGVKNYVDMSDRNDLYQNRINPIVHFTQEGPAAWGQKTLQGKPSALDRINVRRLLIKIRKFLASTSRYLVFEQNTIQTRNRFLNIAIPYLENVQQKQGLYAFRVKMDESNNGPEVKDRNELVGEIWLKPTKTAEFIKLPFNILSTGAEFPE